MSDELLDNCMIMSLSMSIDEKEPFLFHIWIRVGAWAFGGGVMRDIDSITPSSPN